ncbi:tetratricopeptide repeat protein [Candidatus Parcubacteria bacterium]|mgnify:CR=1 FL=1|jgi:tetratricopeptide (TPR) repeat protein|nr:tetratricopeptide repeat protein [Candidatus Parcubacteria bacterium]MBT7227894.1 tetratricopeptide repeat protein [Candidatus Parcubacteria bacterium]
MIDIILIIFGVLALVFIVFKVVQKVPNLTNINVDSLPETRVRKQKDAILKGRLQRSWYDLWLRAKDLSEPVQDKFNNVFRQYYQKLKTIEKDLRRRGHKQLTSSVDKLQTVDVLLVDSKQYINSEEYEKAEETLLDILNIDQHNAEAYMLLAEVYRCRKEYVQAKETLQYLLKLTHDDDAAVYSSLGNIAKERGNLKQAEEDYLKSISLSDDNYFYFLNLAEVYLDLEEQEKALEVAQRALLLSPNNPKVLDFLIDISIIMADYELGKQYLDKLREVNPENQKISELQERIDNL